MLKVIEHGEGGQKYSLVTGEVKTADDKTILVSVISKRLESSLEVAPRMTMSLKVITGRYCLTFSAMKVLCTLTERSYQNGIHFGRHPERRRTWL